MVLLKELLAIIFLLGCVDELRALETAIIPLVLAVYALTESHLMIAVAIVRGTFPLVQLNLHVIATFISD